MSDFPYEVENLHFGFTDVKPIQIDWRRAFETGEAEFWDVEDVEINTDKGRESFKVVVNTNSPCAVMLQGEQYAAFETYEDYCQTLHVDDEGEPVGVQLTEDEFEALMQADTYAEGPMMNYWYPIGLREEEIEAACAIKDLPLCFVKVDDVDGIALTGGGMDLSWQICEAYVRLGYLPPVHFTLPRMADRWTPDHEMVYRAMMRSLASAAASLERQRGDLADTRVWFHERAKS